jgi:hypothetical protein
MTEPADNLAAALAAFQAEMPTVAKTKTAKVETKTGRNYSYTYADLADVTEAAMPLLAKHGLAFIASPHFTEHGYELEGTLLHTSGETVQGTLPIAGHSPQEMGSSLTYMRRYLLGCLTGVVTDDDDDGQIAQQAKRPASGLAKATQKPRGTPMTLTEAEARAVAETGEAMTAKTRATMFALFGDRKVTDRDAQIAGITKVIGHKIKSRGELLESEALAVIASLRPQHQEEES